MPKRNLGYDSEPSAVSGWVLERPRIDLMCRWYHDSIGSVSLAMNIYLTPQQQEIIQQQLKSGRFHSVEEVISEALQSLREQAGTIQPSARAQAVREMLDFVEKNRVRLDGISVKELIHEGHSI